jgi:hypothetical protein
MRGGEHRLKRNKQRGTAAVAAVQFIDLHGNAA